MPGRGLLGGGGAPGARKNKMVKIAVTTLAMVLLLTAAAVSTAPDGRGRLRAFFMMICVLSQINLGRLLAREAVQARTLAARRCYAVSAVACFVELALKLYMIMVLTVILKTAVPVMAMVLLLTASAVSMTPDDCACASLRTCFFRSNCFPMICVLCQINLGRLLAREAVLAPTLAGRRYYAVGAVACFVQLALKLCMILVLCPAAVEGCA